MGSHASRSPTRQDELRVALDALRQIVRTLRLSSTEAEKTHELSGAQLFVLQNLAERPAQSIAELASRTVTDPSSVSVVVKRLVERGLVVRHVALDDARRAELALTRKGESIVRVAPQVSQARLIDAFAKLAPTTRRSLSRGLAELVMHMGGATEPPVLFFEEPDDASLEPPRRVKARRPATRRHALS